MSDKRDWQADMKLCEEAQNNAAWSVRDLIAEQPQMSIYWLQQYAALTEDYRKCSDAMHEHRRMRVILEDRLNTATSRVQKLKEAMETAQWCLMREAYLPAEDAIEDALRSIYQDTAVMDKEAES